MSRVSLYVNSCQIQVYFKLFRIIYLFRLVNLNLQQIIKKSKLLKIPLLKREQKVHGKNSLQRFQRM